MTGPATLMPNDEFEKLFERVKNWGRWGADDELGAVNLISAEKRVRAAKLVRHGVQVSCAHPLATQPGVENPNPVQHFMIRAGDIEGAPISADYFGMAPHGMAHTHLDALCHVFVGGQMYNGRPASLVGSTGAMANAIDVLGDGIVSRGVLLDVPRAGGKEWLEAGEAIYVEDLEKAEQLQQVRVEEGDILLIRTGRHRRRAHVGEVTTREAIAGLDGSCLTWIRDRGVAILGGDGPSDVIPADFAPISVGPRGTPIHSAGIAAMGLHLIDHCALDELADTCARLQSWEFMLSIGPLRLLKGTASPVNPIALF